MHLDHAQAQSVSSKFYIGGFNIMPFVPKKQAFNARINEVTLGVGDRATTIGGQNVLPFYTFDEEIKNAPKIGVELTDFGMTWAVKLLQENFNNVPLALDTANKRAIEAGIQVYNRTNGKPIVNSADAGSRISNIDLAAANGAIVIALCSADGIAMDNEERM